MPLEKSLLVETSKGEEIPWVKKKGKKTGPKKKERIPFCREKKKILGESDWYSAPCWRPDEVAVNPNFFMHEKLGFLFIYTSTSLNTKTLTIASNRYFGIIKKSYPRELISAIRVFLQLSVDSLSHLSFSIFSGLSFFAAGFSFSFSNFSHYCIVLLKTSLSNRNTKTCLRCDTFPGRSWFIVIDARRSRWPVGLRLRRQGIPWLFQAFEARKTFEFWCKPNNIFNCSESLRSDVKHRPWSKSHWLVDLTSAHAVHKGSTTRPCCRSFEHRIKDESRFSFDHKSFRISPNKWGTPQVPASRPEPYACTLIQCLPFAHECTLLTWENVSTSFFALVLSGHVGFVRWKRLFWHSVSNLWYKKKWQTTQRTLLSYGCTRDVFEALKKLGSLSAIVSSNSYIPLVLDSMVVAVVFTIHSI